MKNWVPNRPISQGAIAYHKAVAQASWHKSNINALITLVGKRIGKTDTIVDFGAGTGASAIYLLPKLSRKNTLILADNSASWLAQAYALLHKKQNVIFCLCAQEPLDRILGVQTIDHVVCANTVHLIPDIQLIFTGIGKVLKPGGTFTFQSGNIIPPKQAADVLMIEDSINHIHDLALTIIDHDDAYMRYRTSLPIRIREQEAQRRFVFPTPRPIDFYNDALQASGFTHISISQKEIHVTYKDWLQFLSVKRLQAGILPEVGGKDATVQEAKDRNAIIERAALQFFAELKRTNSRATRRSFVAEWTYVQAQKLST